MTVSAPKPSLWSRLLPHLPYPLLLAWIWANGGRLATLAGATAVALLLWLGTCWSRTVKAEPAPETTCEPGQPSATETRLAEDLAASRRFASMASHEMRTPLTVLRGAIENASLLMDSPGGEARGALQNSLAEIERLEQLLDDLAVIAHGEQKTLSMRIEPGDAAALVREVCERYLPLASSKAVRLLSEAPERLPMRFDAMRLEQALGNLIRNAVRYTPPGGRVSLGATRRGETAFLSVRDTGRGIPPERRMHLFTAPAGDSAAQSEGGGFGLGLALGRQIARAHGGELTLECPAEGGSLFTMALPLQGAKP